MPTLGTHTVSLRHALYTETRRPLPAPLAPHAGTTLFLYSLADYDLVLPDLFTYRSDAAMELYHAVRPAHVILTHYDVFCKKLWSVPFKTKERNGDYAGPLPEQVSPRSPPATSR